MSTLYLHIGTPKTGTSAIQDFCDANRAQLRRRGCTFPSFAPYRHVRVGRNAHFMVEYLIAGFQQASPAGKLWRQYFDEIEEAFRDTPNVLLSDEGLWERSRGEGQPLWSEVKREADARGFDVKIIVYLRRQDQYLGSSWMQSVKVPWANYGWQTWPEAFAQAVDDEQHDYFSHLEQIAAVFGRENIITRIYERRCFANGDILSDFLNIFGFVMDDEFVRLKADVNPSLTGNICEIKRILNNLPYEGDERLPLLRWAAIECSLLDEERAPTSLFTAQELADFLTLCEPSNRQLARAYFGTDEPLFSLPGQLPPKWEQNDSTMIASVVRYFGTIIVQQQREIDELKSRFYLRRKLRRLIKSLPERLRKRTGAKSKG